MWLAIVLALVSHVFFHRFSRLCELLTGPGPTTLSSKVAEVLRIIDKGDIQHIRDIIQVSFFLVETAGVTEFCF